MKKLLLAIAATAALAGCSQKPESAAPATAATPETPPAAAEPAAPSTAPTTAELDQAATATQESGDTAPPPAGDTALERAVAMPESAQLPGGRWKAGTHYRPIVPSQPTTASAGEVEVIEFMWLACGACYQLNERVTSWKSRLPAWVKFRQEHVMWGASHRNLGKLLYTLDALGRSDLVGAAFEEIHRKGNMLVDANDVRTLDKQLAFARANGIAEADFRREYGGFAVATRLTRAEEMTRRYKVEETPVFIVNGKYYTTVAMAGGAANLIELVNDLAAAEKR